MMNQKFFLILFLLINPLVASSQNNSVDLEKNINKPKFKLNSEFQFSRISYEPRGFSFGTNLYLWMNSLNGSFALPLNVPGLPPQTPTANIHLKFTDALKYLKFAIMFAGSFRQDRWGLVYDVDYMKVQYNATVGANSGYKDADLTLKYLTADINISYRFKARNRKLENEGYAGVRIWSLDPTLDLIKNNDEHVIAGESRTWVDPVLGVSNVYNFSPKWFSYFRADVGGFGISSKLSWHLMGALGFRFSPHWNTTLGLKFLDVNYDRDNFKWNVAQSGLLISIGYKK